MVTRIIGPASIVTIPPPVVNGPPVWTSVPLPSFTVGTPAVFPMTGTYQLNGVVTDPEHDPITITWNKTSPQNGVSWDGGRWVYDGAGTGNITGNFLTADDGQGNSVTTPSSFTITITTIAPPTNVAPVWGTPAPTFTEGVTSIYSFPVTDADGDTLATAVGATSAVYPSWLSIVPTPPPRLQATTPPLGTVPATLKAQVDDSHGHVIESPAFGVVVSAFVPPVVVDTWERLDSVASFNAAPAATNLKGPSFGGAVINTTTGDIFFRNSASSPNWNCFFRFATRVLEGVTVAGYPANDGGTTHNHMWCYDADRNCFWSDSPAPIEPGWNACHIKYDLNTNMQSNPFPADPQGDTRPGMLGPPYLETLSGYESRVDYFNGCIVGWGKSGAAYGPMKRRNFLVDPTGNLVETLFPGDPYFAVPTTYSSPVTHDYLGQTASWDSRTGQLYYVDPNLDLWVNNSLMDGTPRAWFKLPIAGPTPVPTSPAAPAWRRHAVLHEGLNCIVVIAWTAASYPSSFTSVIELSTPRWRPGPTGALSPTISSYGDTQAIFSGELLYDRVRQRVVYVVPHTSSGGTAFYELHVAEPTV